MIRYCVVEDMRFMFNDPDDIEIVAEFDTIEEAESYINMHFNTVEWDGQIHDIYHIVKRGQV